jgi:hypothetical protein
VTRNPEKCSICFRVDRCSIKRIILITQGNLKQLFAVGEANVALQFMFFAARYIAIAMVSLSVYGRMLSSVILYCLLTINRLESVKH